MAISLELSTIANTVFSNILNPQKFVVTWIASKVMNKFNKIIGFFCNFHNRKIG